MRVICDTNIFITYLISPLNRERAVVRLIEAAISGVFTLVIPAELVEELIETVARKPHLARQVGPEQIEHFLSVLFDRAELLPAGSLTVTRVTRDPEDDYLLAASAFADVDVLVTGDLDLLVLRDRLKRPAIMRAAEFLEMIESGAPY
ncbi:MAG: putative toxin-antitoxin system toxin component, PIN family [Thermomicrobiales bacterium]|nr:putative toxin-antitoxin system toxin component, PIN family [Thermomicrobiales bacterium]